MRICGAVQHAHQNLVIHRDLKPGNILVTPDGEPKLVDFGIAKVLRPGADGELSALTRHDRRSMTPRYASPEQLRGEHMTTASDIYTLGALLYELLTGRLPHETPEAALPAEELVKKSSWDPPLGGFSGPAEAGPHVKRRVAGSGPALERAICEQIPWRPSQVAGSHRRRLKGDLDAIVMMAVRKEPERRYRLVDQLADDIRRHLDGQPVVARPDTVGYRAAKFIRRNRLATAASVAAAVILIVGIVATTLRRCASAFHRGTLAAPARVRRAARQGRRKSLFSRRGGTTAYCRSLKSRRTPC